MPHDVTLIATLAAGFVLAFVFGFIAIVMILVVYVVVMGLLVFLPIHIANERRHSKADAIKVCAILSLVLLPLWFVAIIWAFTEDNRHARFRR